MCDEPPTAAHLPDDGLVRRVKALACTAPLQALDTRKTSLEWVDAGPYQMAEIALHVIDQVTVAMDFDTGADHERVIDQVQGFVAVQAPSREGREHRAVAEWVLHRLINIGAVDRGFTQTYGRIDDSGGYGRFDFDFKLLEERVASDGRICLRATDEAINVLVGALDTDVESAQVAAEYKLANLINRGRLEDAKLAAEQARYRTVQYGEQLRQYLDATRRDVRTVDWEHEVPELLESALTHIEGRYQNENAILKNITEHRDQSEDRRRKQHAADLVGIVRDCIRRHMQLQNKLQGAGALFRSEQDRQQFAGPPQRAAVDLFGQLLVPVLGLPIHVGLHPVADFFRSVVAPVPPSVLSLSSLVDRMLQPPSTQAPFAGEVPVPVLERDTEAERFTEAEWRISDDLLALSDRTYRLSELLVAARGFGPDVERLVVHRAAHATSPAVSEAVLRGDTRVLLALAVPETFEGTAIAGDELLLTAARIVTESRSEEEATDERFTAEEFTE